VHLVDPFYASTVRPRLAPHGLPVSFMNCAVDVTVAFFTEQLHIPVIQMTYTLGVNFTEDEEFICALLTRTRVRKFARSPCPEHRSQRLVWYSDACSIMSRPVNC
jgi:hypothetical protein